MERTSALGLASRMMNTPGWDTPKWPEAKFNLWVEELETLDEGAAGTAWVKLRRTHNHCPTIAEFRAATTALNTHDRSTREATPHCTVCDGHGWAHIDHADADGQPTGSHAEPCRCPNGRRVEASHRAIIDHNNDELTRLGVTLGSVKDYVTQAKETTT